MGAPEPCEKVREGESGPMLDLMLPCCERGRIDSRLIHEPLDENESLASSAMGGGAQSPCLIKDCRLLVDFGGVVCEPVVRA